MTTFYLIFSNVVLLMALIVPGWLLGKLKRIEEPSVKTMGNLLTDVAMPFLVLSNLLELELSSVRIFDVCCCLFFPIVIAVASFLVAVCLFSKKDKQVSVNRFCSIFPNCGFMGIPLATLMFPERPEIAVYVSLFNILSTFLLLTFGVKILSDGSETGSLRNAFLRPITVSVLLGFLLLFLKVDLPQLEEYCSLLAKLTTPLSMIVLGYELSKIRLRTLFCRRALYVSAFVKLLAAPLISFVLLFLMRLFFEETVSDTLILSIFIATAVPTAASASAMSRQYGLDGEHAAILTLGNSLLSVGSLPLLYLLFDLVFHF